MDKSIENIVHDHGPTIREECVRYDCTSGNQCGGDELDTHLFVSRLGKGEILRMIGINADLLKHAIRPW